jgi:hypothetical protein
MKRCWCLCYRVLIQITIYNFVDLYLCHPVVPIYISTATHVSHVSRAARIVRALHCFELNVLHIIKLKLERNHDCANIA